MTGGKPTTMKHNKHFYKLEVKKILKISINIGTSKGRMLVYENEKSFNWKPIKNVLTKTSIPKGRKITKKKVLKLKSWDDWNDDDLDILKKISSNTRLRSVIQL